MVGAGRLGFGRRVFFFRFRSLGFLLDFGGRDAGLLEEQRGLGRGKLFALGSPGAEVEQADFFVLDVEELVLVVNDFVLVLNDLLQARVRVFSKSMPLSNKVNSSATMRKAPGSAVLGQAKRPRPSRQAPKLFLQSLIIFMRITCLSGQALLMANIHFNKNVKKPLTKTVKGLF